MIRVKKRTAYSLAAGAAVAAPADVDAGLVVSPLPSNPSVGLGFSQPIDFDGDGFTDISLRNYFDGYGGSVQSVFVSAFPGKAVGSAGYATALDAGSLIDATTTAGGPYNAILAQATGSSFEFDGNDAYIGVEFPISGVSHFGWARVFVDNASATLDIKELVYDDTPGAAVTIAAIPETATLGFFAAGAVGLAALRRHRRTASLSDDPN